MYDVWNASITGKNIGGDYKYNMTDSRWEKPDAEPIEVGKQIKFKMLQ